MALTIAKHLVARHALKNSSVTDMSTRSHNAQMVLTFITGLQ